MVEYRLPKPGVVGSSPIARSNLHIMKNWFLIIEPDPLPGSRNMAVDEFLFERARRTPSTFLRFYRWIRPTASLGYGQSADRAVDIDFCRAHGVDVVRRMTGGKVVLHHRELTYSLASSDVETFTATLSDSYKLISRALVLGLESMGLAAQMAAQSPPAYIRKTMPCFAFPARDEIEIDGLKIIGSAQKRTGSSFVQHGSVPLENDQALLKSVARTEAEAEDVHMTSLSEALRRPVDFAWAAERFADGFSRFFGAGLTPIALGAGDAEEVSLIESARYGNDAWTLRR